MGGGGDIEMHPFSPENKAKIAKNIICDTLNEIISLFLIMLTVTKFLVVSDPQSL